MKRKLRSRIMTLILVVFLPIFALLTAMSAALVHHFSDQLRERTAHELETAMSGFEQDILSVEYYAGEFADRYLTEINAPDGLSGSVIPYDMIRDLGRWYSLSGLSGFVYLYDYGEGRCYTRHYGSVLNAAEINAAMHEVEKLAGEGRTRVFELESVGGRDCLVRSYSYRSCSIGFVIDVDDNLRAHLGILYDEVAGEGASVRRAVVWRSERLPLTVRVSCDRFAVLRELPGVEWVLLAVALACLLFFPLIWRVLRIEVLEPMDRLTRALNELRDGNEDYRIGETSQRYSDEILMLFDVFDQSAEQQKRSHERELQLVRTELDNLRLQVNPHMLLNSYNLIFAMAQSKDFQRIQDYSYLLVRYFRYVLRKNDDFVPLSREIEFIGNYVEIQSIRHPGAFHYSCKVQPPCERTLIPPLLVENFIENSMKHALSPGRTVEILMDIKREGDRVLIAVSDTGNGIAPGILEKLQKGEPYVDPAGNRHIGIWNSMRRVELFYGEKASFEIVSAPDEGTSMILKIPYREAESHEASDRG